MAKVTLNDLSKALGLNEKEPKKDFHYYGTIVDSNPEDNTYQVSINRDTNISVEAARLVGAARGDTVMVTVMANGYATVTGRLGGDLDATDAQRAADDAADVASSAMGTASSALSNAQQANQAATAARTLAEHAEEEAGRAHTAAEQAAEDASSAASSASSASTSASNAAASASTAQQEASAATTAANQAKTQAQAAETAATEATEAAGVATTSANSALTQLGTVEDVIGTLDWIAEHAVYHPTSDQEAESGKMYFEVTATAVTSPTASGLPSYYELNAGKYYPTADTTVNPTKTYYTLEATPVSVPAGGDPSALGYYQIDRIDEAVSNYIATHLALTDSGLYILMDESGYKLRLTNDGAYIEDPSGATVATYSTEAVIGNLNGYNYLRLSRTGLTLTTDGGQSAAFEVVLYDDTTISTSTSFGHQFETYNGAYVAGLDPRIADGAITLTLTMYNSMDGQTYTETKTFTAGSVSQQTAFVYNDPQKGEQKFLVQYDGKYFIALVCQYNYDSYTLTVNGTATYYIQTNRSTYYTLGRRASGLATGQYSVAEGYNVTASGNNSHAQNTYTIAGYNSQTAIGRYNDNQSDTAFEIGNGAAGARSNALIVDWNGNVMAQGMAGMIQMFAGATAPTGWLLCNGAAVSRTDYAELFAVIGTTYGAGDGSTTFNLPDMQGRFPLGKNGSYALNAKGGAATITLSSDQTPLPSHKHGTTITQPELNSNSHSHNTYYTTANRGSGSVSTRVGPVGSTGTAISTNSDTHTHTLKTNVAVTVGTPTSRTWTGSGISSVQPHDNMPPYIGINFIIATGKTS